jgi:hypothetical protein
MNSYHGTSTTSVIALASGKVNVTLGGGELGQGFYTGEYLHEAKAWAYHKSGDKQQNVVCFSAPDTEIEKLHFAVLDQGAASLKRYQIKKAGHTRTHLFKVDLVWAPIVGSERASGEQYKWESKKAEVLLNGPLTAKAII